MSVAETSKMSYYDHVNSGKKLKQREAIVKFMSDSPFSALTRRDLATFLKFELGATAGRVNKLISDGILEECGTTKCGVTNKTVKMVRLTEASNG